MLKRRLLLSVTGLFLLTLGLPGNLPADAARESNGPARNGLLGTELKGTGVLPNFSARGDNLIRLLAGAFDPLTDAPPGGAAGIPLVDEETLPASTAQYWLVQVKDRQYPAAADAVSDAGGLIVGYIPTGTYMVRATPAQRVQIDESAAVRWTGYYQPAWRVPVAAGGKKALLALDGAQIYRVHVFRADPNPGAVGDALASMAGVEVLEDAGVVVDVRATAAEVPAIAALPAVEWVGLKPKGVFLNSNSRWVNDTGVRDLFAATAAGRLNGAGQTAAVADSGLNYTYDLNRRAHIAFRDCNPDGTGCKQAIYTSSGSDPASINNVTDNETDHRKMVAYFDLGNAGPNMFDESSHGSHVAGSVSGDQPEYDEYTGDDGLAPAANHVHQNIADPGGGLSGIPEDDYDLWRQAYRPRDPASVEETSGDTGNPQDYTTEYVPLEDARAHNNSYGLLVDVIDEGSAVRLDQFVWDHEDMVIAVSAGNSGPAPSTIGSPSVAKNELSSAASANGRQPMVSIDSLASFSSHGPTGDGRFGPDLATPGQIVVSVKGGSTDGYHTAQGTSMSSPVLTGLATLVRQYFFDGYAAAGGDGFAAGSPSEARVHNPSAALVKAALINGAVRMQGYYTGDDGTKREMDGQWPSAGQGFGRVNLDNSLYFDEDRANNWYRDVYRADTDAFPVSATPDSREYTIHVDDGQPLDVTLSWTDAPNLAPAGTPALVNNLDLVVTGPGGATYVGNNMNTRSNPTLDNSQAETMNNAAAPRDVRNLTERVRVANPPEGDYTIRVEAPPIAIGRQGFALAASGDISPVGESFAAGPPLQVDEIGTPPAISDVKVDTLSSNTAKVTFTTSEPTTATADTTVAGGPHTFVDSYNIGSPADWPGLNPANVETSAEYANKPVVGTKHEILMTGFTPGQNASALLKVKDLANNEASQTVNFTTPATVYQADALDIGQLWEDGTTQWRTGTQLYAGDSDAGDGVLGAFAFRVPEAAVDPATITGAAVELTSKHNWVVPYTSDPEFNVDLLNPSVEPRWGTQNYEEIKTAARDARVYPETTHKRGAYQKYGFTFRCSELQKLKDTLASVANGERMAAFRWESNVDPVAGVFSMEFGFNRRSRGPDTRPKLILFTDGQTGYPDGRACDPNTPAPTISQVGIHEGTTEKSMTVSWETDVDSDSFVLFREKGTTPWTQVGTPALTKIHQVQVFGLESTKHYEFVVRSAACNGAVTTDTNGGEAYDFFRGPPPDPGPRTEHASYSFEAGAQDWTVTTVPSQIPPDSTWVRGAPGASGTNGWHVAIAGNPANKGYSDEDETMLTSPAVTFEGAQVGVEFQLARNTEPAFDFVHVDYSADGAYWITAASFDGTNEDYPLYEPAEVRFNHPNPGGSLQIRFRFSSDLLFSSPEFLGASVDEVKFASYPNAGDELPLTGPVPPPSAEGLGITAPALRTGPATAADQSAGTGYCAVPAAPDPAKPDLTLDSSDISASRTNIVRGRRVILTAVVHNIGEAAAQNVTVRFLEGNTQVGKIRTIASIPAGGTGTARVTWTPRRAGRRTITVILDGANTIAEENEQNNSASKTFRVRAPSGGDD